MGIEVSKGGNGEIGDEVTRRCAERRPEKAFHHRSHGGQGGQRRGRAGIATKAHISAVDGERRWARTVVGNVGDILG
jgi:hypothetical protein